MRLSSYLVSSLLIAALAAAVPGLARAEVYKWIDDKGVVNYGDQPPASSKNAMPLDATTSTLSVVPGLPQDVLQRELERALEWRVNQLEQELNDQRVRAAMSATAPALDTTGMAMGARLYGYPVVFARPVPPRRPHVRDPRDQLLPTLVRPPEHR